MNETSVDILMEFVDGKADYLSLAGLESLAGGINEAEQSLVTAVVKGGHLLLERKPQNVKFIFVSAVYSDFESLPFKRGAVHFTPPTQEDHGVWSAEVGGVPERLLPVYRGRGRAFRFGHICAEV